MSDERVLYEIPPGSVIRFVGDGEPDLRTVRQVREWACVKGLKEYDCWQAVNMAPVEYSCGHEDCHQVWREVPDEQ